MWWRKKNNSNRYIKNNKHYRFVIVVGLLLILTVVTALVNSQIASADADSDLKAEVNRYKIAQKIKACKSVIYSDVEYDHVLLRKLDETSLNEWNTSDQPYDEGIRVPDKRKRVKCDFIYLAAQNGQGEYFKNYFLEHARLTDKATSTGEGDTEMSEVVLPGSNHTAVRVKDKLNNNDLRGLSVRMDLLKKAVDAYPSPNMSDAAWGQIYWEAINSYCTNGQSSPFTEASDGEYSYKAQGDDGKYVVKRGYFNGDKGRNISVWPGFHENTGIPDMTCGQVLEKYSELAQKHVDTLNKHIDANPDDSKDTNDPDSSENKDECASEFNGFGSLICSGQNLFVTITQILFDTVSKILESQAELTKENAVRQQWGNLLNVANAILIIAFLVVIYSTATSTGGLSNYDVKKLLPRIIIFAIAINLSYYICMALVDLSNILGHGIFGLFLGGKTGDAPQLMKTAKATADAISIPPEVGAITTVAIAAVLIFLVGPPMIIALLTILFALVVRGMALMILVIISPVAIASYLFNNQGLSKGFTMWRDNYIKLLLVYPLFMLVWAGSRVVSSLNPSNPDPTLAIFSLIMEVICLVAPAMSILPLFKMSGDIMGKATIAAHSNQAANKFAGWAGSKFTGKPGDPNSPGLRGKAAGVIGAAAGAAAGRAAGAVQNMRGVGASTGNIATQLDSQAMNSARNKVDKYGDRDRKTAFTTGQIGGKTLDPYQMRAVIEKELPNASAAEVKQSMQAVNTEADRLRRNGQAADADRLVQTFANTASANGNSIMGGKSLRNFATSGGWNTSQFEANYADAVADYSSTQLTAQDAAGMDAADLIQMRQTLQNSGANGGDVASADAGMRNMARQSNIALSDPELTRKMSAPTVTALNDNTMVRSTAGEKVADAYKVPNIYHDYNAGGAASTKAISDAKTMMMRAGFSKLDAIDQSRLRTIASASTPTGTGGAPTTPVVIATWDKRR